MMDETQLGTFIDTYYRQAGDRLYRREGLPVYDVPGQAAQLQAWRAGGEPDWEAKRKWWKILAAERSRNMISRRVRVLSRELTDDELCACQWGYVHTGQWEDIRVLRVGEHDIPEGLIDHDYWIVADEWVITMDYDTDGRFHGADVLSPKRLIEYMRDRERAWDAAEPFDQWWARHAELHGRRLVA